MKRFFIMAAIAASIAGLPGCEYLAAADALSETAVRGICGQSEINRVVQRQKLAGWGLWAECVPGGTLYGDYQLVKKENANGT